MKSDTELRQMIDRHGDTIRRICFLHLNRHADAEDVFQDVFLKYILCEQCFENESHEKAWLIRVAINRCKDVEKSFFHRRVTSIHEMNESGPAIEKDSREVLDAVLRLPNQYRDVIYLFYYEGYTAVEIARLLNRRENTIYTWLSRARQQLKEWLGGDFDG